MTSEQYVKRAFHPSQCCPQLSLLPLFVHLCICAFVHFLYLCSCVFVFSIFAYLFFLCICVFVYLCILRQYLSICLSIALGSCWFHYLRQQSIKLSPFSIIFSFIKNRQIDFKLKLLGYYLSGLNCEMLCAEGILCLRQKGLPGSHTGHICFTFPHCVFSNVSSKSYCSALHIAYIEQSDSSV